MKKRIMSLVMAVALVLCLVPWLSFPVNARGIITSCDSVSGSDFTNNASLVSKLDSIFAGNANIYSNERCTNLVNTALGTYSVPNNGVKQYVGAYGSSAQNSGTSCWIYANGVYFTLFGEALGNGSPGSNSEKIELSTTATKKLTYENLCAWGVRDSVGAQIRVGNHSLIVLDYDNEQFVFLDGNGDGHGLVAVRIWTWTEVQTSTNTNGTVQYIIQPKSSYMDATFPGYSNEYLGLCVDYPSYGEATLKNDCNLHPLPCSNTEAEKHGFESKAQEALSAGQSIKIHGIIYNTANHYWYKVTTESGQTGYVYSAEAHEMEQLWPYVEGDIVPDTISDAVFLGGKVIAGGSRIESVCAFVCPGETIAGQVLSSNVDYVNTTTSYSLKKSPVDYSLPFQDLSNYGNGTYTIAIEVGVTNYLLDGYGNLDSKSLCIIADTDTFEFTGNSTPPSQGEQNVAETADFISRSDGVWLWPLPQSAYNKFTDWAGCHGYSDCPFHGEYHSGWGDSYHTNNKHGHNGIDIGVSVGTEVYATADGVLFCTSTDWSSRGITAIVEHPAGVDANGTSWSYYSIYQHLNSVVSSLDGQTVSAGDVIAYSGNTDGAGTGQAHLHFGIVLAPSGYGYSFSRNPNGGSENQLYWVESKGWILITGYQIGRILPNPALNSPAGFPSGHSEVVPPLEAHAGSVMYTFNKAEVKIGAATDICLHNYAATVTEPTCTEEGYTTYTCTKCSDSYLSDYVDATGHSYNDWDVILEPTCTDSGIEISTCASCGDITHQVISSTGHSYGEWHTVTVATCTSDGLQESTCDSCGDVQTQLIESTGHDYQSTTVEPTCQSEGYTTHICVVCEYSYTDAVVPASDHSYGDWFVVIEPTCTKQGVEQQNCQYCGHAELRATDANGHSLIHHEAQAPTCTEPGWAAYETCENCDHSTYAELAATGHSFGAWFVVIEPTCTKQGVEQQNCQHCGHAELRATDANGHSLIYHEAQAPTCTEPGWEAYETCENCDHSTYAELTATGHSYGDGEVTAEPTCTELGVKTYTCPGCGNSYTEEIPALGHSLVDGACEHCGELEVQILVGDINGDGWVDVEDAMLILQLEAMLIEEEGMDLSAADVNGDGWVDVEDAMLILQFDALLIDKFPIEE